MRGSWLAPFSQLEKYFAIGAVTAKNKTAYVVDFVLRQLFLMVIIFTFSQLWKATYAASGSAVIGGFTAGQILWYLVLTESFTLGLPRAAATMDSEVKSGQIAYTMLRPYSFLLYHYASYIGEALIRVPVNLVMGGMIALAVVGRLQISVVSLLLTMLMLLLGATLQFTITASIGLLAFWFEDTSSFQLLYSRALLLLGGVLLPLELFPPAIRQVIEALPVGLIVYEPARMFVGHTEPLVAISVLQRQILWIVPFCLLLMAVYRLGVKKTNVNGG